MPNETPTPEESPYFGDDDFDATPWLVRWVKVILAEHHSDIYDALPKGAITLIVTLTLQGMNAANETLTDEPPSNAL